MSFLNRTTLILSTVALSLASGGVWAKDYTVDATHSSVEFTVKHLVVSRVTGKFKEFSGEFSVDEKKPEAGKVSFTVKVDSINTDNEKRDSHLKDTDFFDAKQFPTMTFVSKKVKKTGKNKAKVTGDLTIKGKTHEETFDVEYHGKTSFMGSERVGFTATTTIDRQKYGVSWNKKLDTGNGVVVSDDVLVTLHIEGMEKKPEEGQQKDEQKKVEKKQEERHEEKK